MESEKIERLRNIKLEAVLESAGAARDPKDRNNWRADPPIFCLAPPPFSFP